MCPVGISPRVAKIFTAFATITNGHSDGMCLVGISPRVAKQLQHLPPSPMTLPTESVSLVFYRELQKNYCPCHNHRRKVQIPMHATVRLLGRSAHLPMEAANPMRACSDTFLPMDFEKSRGIFKNLVRNSKNIDGNYRRK